MAKIHKTEIRVRYQETDNMGVVYYANYFIWFEVARTEYFRSLGVNYRRLEEKGAYLMVAKASCDYKSPAKYDDIVRIETSLPELKNSSLKFAHKLFVNNRLIATGESLHVFTNRASRPMRIPEEVSRLISSSELSPRR